MANYTFDQLVDITQVRQLLETHHTLTGMAYGLLDTEENNLIAVGWQDICLQFHRVHPVSCLYCRESDAYIKKHLHDFKGDFLEYRCKNGMIDVAIPIIINGEHVATFFTGQFFYDDDKADEYFFRTQAQTLGFDADNYLTALKRVPVFSRDHVRNNMLFLCNMVNVLARCGFSNLKLTQEIEERKRTEQLLYSREQEFRALVENAPDPIIRYDGDCRCLYVNPAVERLSGKPAASLIGSEIKDALLAPPALGNKVVQCIRQVLATGQSVEAEVGIPDQDGHLQYFLNSYAPEWGMDGKVTSVLAFWKKITDRKQMEEALLESEKNLRGLMECMPAGCIWTDIGGHVEYVNKYFVELFGYTLDEIPTLQVLFERIYPDLEQRKRIHAAHANVFSNAQKIIEPFQSVETWITSKDGAVRHVIVNTHPVRTCLFAVLTDITEREFIHNELLKAHKLEALGVLAGGIAHDFNNLLTGIIGGISIAQDSLDATSDAHKSLGIAQIATQRATELTRRLIAFAKDDVLNKKRVFVRHLVTESVSLALQGSSVQGTVHIPDTLHDVAADAGQLSQVFNNIITNAVQSMPKGGRLTVQADNVDLDERKAVRLPSGPYIRISFTDEGCGITEENLQKIFDPYFTTKASGTGLGLASCQSIAFKHGGRISVSSIVGAGTTFTIYLPSLGNAPQEDLLLKPRPGKKEPTITVQDRQAVVDKTSCQLDS